MNSDLIRFILTLASVYMVYKTVSAPKRGTFLTIFGNIKRDIQPRAFVVCIAVGWVLAITLLLAAVFADKWLPIFVKFYSA